jgi:hypothetical protein
MKKGEMVLQLVFREPAETLHATTAPACHPPFSHSPNPRRVTLCVARPSDSCTNVVGLFFRASTLHSFVSWEARLQRAQRGDSSRSRGRGDGLSFQTSTLSQANIYRASLMGDQATMKRRLGAVDGRRSVDSNACRSSAAVRKEGLKLSCAHKKRRTEYQARDAARGQSQ